MKTQIIEIYGKEIESKGHKFIVASAKIKDGSYANVRFVQGCDYKATKGLQKIEFDPADANTKKEKGKDGKMYQVIYIKKCKGIEFTEEEKQAQKEKQAQAVADLFN